ncbi:hemicentin-2-like [Branchiostoma floridae]|uniref:Hemicentin-2-like n=1 Tax=Branchiostoma floridae TaxID=7739 RepID=A0A9J7MD27_BRAFL|nr:hemicentin-2-like [Branchiostoma floridae]
MPLRPQNRLKVESRCTWGMVFCNKGLPASTKVQVSPGDTANLPATYNPNDHVIALTWNKMDERLEGTRTPVFLHSLTSSVALGPLKDRAQLNPNGSLTVWNVTVKDEGQYVMTVLVDAVGQQEHYVYLDVMAPPLVTVGLQSPLRVSLRSSVILNCTVEKTSTTLPRVYWLQDGRQLSPHVEKLDIETPDKYRSSLVLRRVARSDSGNYTCVAQQGRSEQADSLSLVVVYPAKVVNVSSPLQITSGTKATIWCIVDGNPKPEVRWRKVGSDVDLESGWVHHGKRTSSLSLHSLRVAEAGYYACVAKNKLGDPDRKVVPVMVVDKSYFSAAEGENEGKGWREVTAILGGAAGGATVLLAVLLGVVIFSRRAKIEDSQTTQKVFSLNHPTVLKDGGTILVSKDERLSLTAKFFIGNDILAEKGGVPPLPPLTDQQRAILEKEKPIAVDSVTLSRKTTFPSSLIEHHCDNNVT